VSVRIPLTGREVSDRWPHIRRYLLVDGSTGRVEDDYLSWYFVHERVSLPCGEVAAGFEEWASFYEWRLEQRAEELAGDASGRGLLEEWTDSMTYLARRCAAAARGEDPGEWVPQRERRPDLMAAKRARVAKIIAELEAGTVGSLDRRSHPATRSGSAA
jgi:hypothetical protein